MPPREALRAAYYATRGAVAFKPVDHDEAFVLRCYERFYEIARRHSGLNSGAFTLARVLTELHAELFGLAEGHACRRSGARVRRPRSTASPPARRRYPQGDWTRLEVALRRRYEVVVGAPHG